MEPCNCAELIEVPVRRMLRVSVVTYSVILHHSNNDIEWMAEAKVVNDHCEEVMDTALFDIIVLIVSILNFLTDEDIEGDVDIMIMPHDDLVSVHGYGYS